MKKTTLSMHDIARKCKVSVATVSRVFNDHKNVSDKVPKRVSKYIEDNHYDPYRNIPLLRKLRTRSLKVVAPYYTWGLQDNPFFSKAMSGLNSAAARKKYSLELTTEDDVLAELDKGTESFDSAAGILILCPILDWDKHLDMLKKANVPIALVNRHTRHTDIISVIEKRPAGMQAAVDLFLSLGYKNIAGICNRDPDTFAFKALEAAFKARNLNCGKRRLIPIEYKKQLDIPGLMASYHKKGDMPEALLIGSDGQAIAAMKALQALGYRIPQDVAIIGHNNVILGKYCSPELTSVDVPVDRLAAMAVTMLIEQAESGMCHGMHVELDNELIIRGSCGSDLKNKSPKTS